MHGRFMRAAVASTVIAALSGCTGTESSPTSAPASPDDTASATQPGGGTSYPESDITFIVPFAAGSGPDANARVIVAEMERDLGVSIIVENVEGAAGTVGYTELANSEPDGYTIGWATAGGIVIQSRIIDNPFEGLESLTPIARVNLVPNVMFASPDRGWDSIDAFLEAAGSETLTVGLPPRGSSQDIQTFLLEQAADIDLERVYYEAGQMITPAINGTVDVAVTQFAEVVQFVEAGDLHYVGSLGGQAPEGVEADSFDDAGYDTSAYQGWEGVFAPAGLPDEIATRLAASVEQAMASERYQEYVASVYGLPAFMDQAEFADFARETYDRGPEIIEQMGLGD